MDWITTIHTNISEVSRQDYCAYIQGLSRLSELVDGKDMIEDIPVEEPHHNAMITRYKGSVVAVACYESAGIGYPVKVTYYTADLCMLSDCEHNSDVEHFLATQ